MGIQKPDMDRRSVLTRWGWEPWGGDRAQDCEVMQAPGHMEVNRR